MKIFDLHQLPSSVAAVVLTVAALALVILGVTGCSGAPATAPPATDGSSPVTAKWTKIVRGVNQTRCEAGPIGDGNNPRVGPDEPLTDLSVSCSDDKAVTIADLRAPLANPHICWSDLERLRKANRHVLVVSSPEDDNPYHCLLSVITPRQFVSRSHWRE